jgi:hypothetical protein
MPDFSLGKNNAKFQGSLLEKLVSISACQPVS